MLTKPKRLQPGQTIAVVAPASPARESTEIDLWLERIRELGFRVKAGQHLYDRHGYFAGLDEARATDINAAFADPEVDAIICLRSGYGSSRTLQYLNFDLIRRNPKIIIGFSDLTALLNAIHLKTGLVTFHGPEAEDQIVIRPYSLAAFQKVLIEGQFNITLGELPKPEARAQSGEHEQALIRYVPGKAKGRLMGGNLNTLVALLGTPYEPNFHGTLLFLETYGQDTYALGSMLQHLYLAGKLQTVAGVVFGQFSECEERGFSKHEVLSERMISQNIPSLYGLMISHQEQQATIPLGCMAELDVGAGTLTLLESGVQ